ncbi:ABC transporter ATP-binding protein [Bacillus sp. THAF10]|uniref:ABC transporter ATP-binding protein n=1 Tax=Bacillus sp. THAF10 TaxID=2587848 RepID=UPI00126871AC|nr:ABC transporter ATP-binding protein [Bacillus sp. THAF10]
MSEYILQANNIVKIFGQASGEGTTTAVDGIDLAMKQGEFVAIMGPSGSGKTTLLHLLGGIDKLTSGEVLIERRNLQEMKGDELAVFRRQKLGFVFQDFNLLDSLTIRENILVPMVLENKSIEDMNTKVSQLANLFGIEDILERYPFHVSGGQMQRGAVSRALVNEPSILLADEPTGNLDSKSSAVIMECFEKVVNEIGTTVLVVTHDVFAASYCRKIIFIKDGAVHSTLIRKGDRKQFLHQIMDSLAVLGGRKHDF